MSAIADIFESAGDFVGDIVESVGDIAEGAVQFAGDVIEKTADTVGKTVEKALDDPLGTAAQVVTAIYAPYALPAVSAGVSVANGGDLNDALKSAAMAYAGSEVATGIGGELSSAGVDPSLVKPVAQTATGALKGLAMGQDLGTSLVGGATGAGLGAASGYIGSNISDTLKEGMASTGEVPPVMYDDQGNPLLPADQAYNLNMSLSPEERNIANMTGGYLGSTLVGSANQVLQGDQGAPTSGTSGVGAKPPALGNLISPAKAPTQGSSLSYQTRQQQVADILGLPEFSPLSFGTKLAELGIDPSLASVIMNDPDTLRNLMSNSSQSNYYTYGSTAPTAQSALGSVTSSPLQSTALAPPPALGASAPAMGTSGVGATTTTAGGLPSLPTLPKVAKGGSIHGYAGGGHIPEFSTGAGMNYVRGRGDGQSDDIPAMLADGEYVFDADIVAALGNGSNEAGAKLLDRMREEIRGHKRSAPTNKIPPKAKSPLEYLNQARKKGK